MTRYVLCLLGSLLGPAVLAADGNVAGDPLEAGFAHPPAEARPLAWWHWINGNVTKEGIRADLEDMQRVGIGGAQMLDVSIYLPPGPVRYGSDSWHEHVQYAIRTADELGLELDIANGPGWSASGGPWVTPDRSMKQLVWSETDVEGGAALSVALTKPPKKLDFYRDVAVLAVPRGNKPSKAAEGRSSAARLTAVTQAVLDAAAPTIPADQVLELTKFLGDDGVLRGDLPQGRWTILRFGFTTTGSTNHPAVPEGHGLEIDKLDSEAVAFQFERALGRIIREAGPRTGRAFRGILFDSFEGGFQNWTDTLPKQFRRLKGYDLVPLLPVLTGRVVGSREESEAFLRDFRSAVSQLLARNYFGTMQRLAHEHGLKVYAEAQGGPINPLLCNEYTDVPMNEFWMPDARPRVTNMKQIASIANLLGRKITAAEAFTAKPEDGRWLATPATLKAPGDCAFTTGINRFIFHTYVHQPYAGIAPGFTLGRYGTHFGRLNTWWFYAGEWITYLARCQFLLQQGRTVADICFLADENVGYFVPKGALEVPPGYDFDVCYPQHLAGMVWTEGALRLPRGPAYRVLVLPEKWVADIATLRRLNALVEAGAAVVGPPPAVPAGLVKLRERMPEWRSLVEKLFRHINPRQPLLRALEELQVAPDFSYTAEPADADVRFIHRAADAADLYFLSNQSGKPVALQAGFRAGKRVPELWDPVTGRIAQASSFQVQQGRVALPLKLEAAGSLFVVFRRPLADGLLAGSIQPPPKNVLLSVPVKGPWQVRFQPGRGAPEEIYLDHLSSWTTHRDPGVRFFSGIATYATQFEPPARAGESNVRYILQLGRVCDLAEVKINGCRAGVVWTPPFELDVTELVHAGSNSLEAAVANRWINRLIGDEALPPDARYELTGSLFTRGRLAELPGWIEDRQAIGRRRRIAFTTWQHYEKDSPLVDSGLLGPVKLEFKREAR